MSQSANYDATKEDSRSWRSDHDTRAAAIDAAGVANAAAIQTATQDTNPVTSIVPNTTTAGVTAAAGTQHTHQITITPKVGSTATTSGVQVTYVSSVTAKATVSSSGLVTGVAAGTTTITATAVHDTSQTTTVTVTVT